MRISDWSSDVCSSDLSPPGLKLSSFSVFGKELYYGTLLYCSGRWEVCHLRSEEISLYIRCLLLALQPWRGRARADDFWMLLVRHARYGAHDPRGQIGRAHV